VNSGANYHMLKERELFATLVPTQGQLILGDGKTVLPIQGIGQVKCTFGSELLIIDNVRYVLDLAESIYSLFLHIKQGDHGVQSSFEEGLYLKFPNFTTKDIVGHDDIYLDALPFPDNSTTFGLSSSTTTSPFVEPHCCRHITQPDNINILMASKQQDNLLKTLRQYYSEVKTKF